MAQIGVRLTMKRSSGGDTIGVLSHEWNSATRPGGREGEERERRGEEEGKEVKWKQCGIDKENAFHCHHITLHVFKNDVHLSEVVGVHGLLPDSLSKEHTQIIHRLSHWLTSTRRPLC